MKQVIQYVYQACSKAEAENVADALRRLEDCIDAHAYLWLGHQHRDPYKKYLVSVTAHFEVDQDIPSEALPEGCSLVPASVATFLQRVNGYDGLVKKLVNCI